MSIFGFYLYAYHFQEREAILKGHQLVRRTHWSSPEIYATSYFKEIPYLEEFVRLIGESKDSASHGHSLDDLLTTNKFEVKMQKYYRDRMILLGKREVVSFFTKEIKYFFIHTLVVNPAKKFYRWIHKKLNTEYGKYLKKLGL